MLNFKSIFSNSDVGIDDFEFIKLISKGAYGRVWLVKKKTTGDFYAMKIVDFSERVIINQLQYLYDTIKCRITKI